VLDDAIKRDDPHADEQPFRLITVGGGGPYPQIDLDRPRELMVADAQHAAVAVEHGCTMVTTDSDFDRFPGLRWQHPLRKR
jgi:predicted nucleic acid-binding protein